MFPLAILALLTMSSMALTNIQHSEYDVASGCDVTYGNVLENLTTVRSITECCGHCSVNGNCYSVKYDTDKRICQLNSERYPALSTGCQVRFRYARLAKRQGFEWITRYMFCTLSDECLVRNSQCYHNNCQCNLGYSYNPATESCVESCTDYGSSFTLYRAYRFEGPDHRYVPNADNGTYCMQACVKETNFVCRSLEYVYSSRYCILLKTTALTNPEHLKKTDAGSDFYHRDCQ